MADNARGLDFNSDELYYMDHKFIRTKYSGIYKCSGELLIDVPDWAWDERNKNLIIFTEYRGEGRKERALYLALYDCENRYQFENEFDYNNYQGEFDECYLGFTGCHYCDGLGNGMYRGGVVFEV